MGDGDEALRLYKSRSYDVVLTDLIHPGASGIDICKQILKREPNQALGFLTVWRPGAQSEEHAEIYREMEKFLQTVSIPVLSMPVSIESLGEFVHAICK